MSAPYPTAHLKSMLPDAAPSGPRSLTPEQVAASPILREIAASLASVYMQTGSLDDWLEGSDYQVFSRRSLIADLIDADHVLDPDPNDPEIWLIDRPWLAAGESQKHQWLDDLAPDFDQAPWQVESSP